MDGLFKPPAVVRDAGLNERFAVIQETYVEGCVDRYFDEPLWRTLAEFLRQQSREGTVLVSRDDAERKPTTLDDFLSEWDRTAPDEQYPPPLVTATSDGEPILCMVTENWSLVGGPYPYHDSYTYSLFSKSDVSAEVLAALRVSPFHDRWAMPSQVPRSR